MAGMTLEDARARFAAIAGALRDRPAAIEIRTGFAELTAPRHLRCSSSRAPTPAHRRAPAQITRRRPPDLPASRRTSASRRDRSASRRCAGPCSSSRAGAEHPTASCEDIAVAVSEALNNVVVHAYAGDATPGSVEVDAWTSERSLDVVVCDEGGGMQPHAGSAALGFGFALMIRMTRRLEISESPHGMRLRMRFEID